MPKEEKKTLKRRRADAEKKEEKVLKNKKLEKQHPFGAYLVQFMMERELL